ncbi:MAG TPA: trifunctional transcriptional regulator/proline dehydrogenase/L-glutamate gamma-semialdehyde dehydrogenase, partial [Roseiarcus sp.]|nr:trifunctional transcriptional regulator/proline dehydrogenase/L-glutamate gamma-semialdehyde dehydrogenase [Roseiarcus sp.]
GRIAAVAATTSGFLIEVGAILAAGNDAVGATSFSSALKGLPGEFARRVMLVTDPLEAPDLAGALFEGGPDALAAAMRKLAERPGPIVRLQALTPERLAAGEDFSLADLVEEIAVATNTSAAGGNASLMTIG